MTALNLRIDLPACDPSDTEGCTLRLFPLLLTLEALTQINQWHFQCGRAIPLADSGARYQEEPPGREDWDDCITVAKRGWGDCDDLGPYLAAELRELHGIHAVCIIDWQFLPADRYSQNGVFLVHVRVQLPNGTILDPSKWLGMRGEYH